MSWSAVFNLSALQRGCLTPATCTKFYGCISRSPMCWLAFIPRSGVNSSFTMTDSTEYFLLFLRFRIVTQVIPSGFNSELFHICKTFLVRIISSCPTYFVVSTLTFAPPVYMKADCFSFQDHFCVNFLRIFTVFDCTNRIGC